MDAARSPTSRSTYEPLLALVRRQRADAAWGEAWAFHAWPALLDLLPELAETDGTLATTSDGRIKEVTP